MNTLLEFATNHPWLASGTVFMALAVIFNELRLRSSELVTVSPSQAVLLINKGAKVIDIRDKARFDAGHIVDAMNVATEKLDDEVKAKLKSAKSVLIVCDSGAQSGKAVNNLRKAGFENAYALQGGLGSWQGQNLPVVASS